MNDEKYTDREIKIPTKRTKGKLAKKAENYWYHYKWQTIAAVFVLFVVLVTTLQTCGTDREDLTVVYAGPVQLSLEEAEEIKKVLSSMLSEDINGDGKKISSLTAYRILSEEQILAARAGGDSINAGNNAENRRIYDAYLLTGDVSVCFVDPWLYESLRAADRLEDISSFEGFSSDGTIGNTGMRLGDTEIYKYYGALKVLPEDTVICLLRSNFVGKSRNQDVYKAERNFFAGLLSFRDPS